MQIVLYVAMLIFIALLLLLAVYLLSHLSKDFLIYKPDSSPRIRKAMLITGILLLVISAAGLVILFTASAKSNLITLVGASIVVAGFALSLTLGND
ncbi:hypothetical protein ACFQHW_11980 [Lapidilactobacillus achengensis]|uniref:DUF3784 domain-containing protein n=1 Tax=Lapidilactobacillus achengensis TaxID=2486000 RepID=A0ABW1USV3_9LACO|nr:hypothetical protein [Lapidilactobacillus achengensis]